MENMSQSSTQLEKLDIELSHYAAPVKERLVSYTASELRKMKSKTDWARVNAMTFEDVEASIKDDPDMEGFWDKT
jgi:hypothetical protein